MGVKNKITRDLQSLPESKFTDLKLLFLLLINREFTKGECLSLLKPLVF